MTLPPFPPKATFGELCGPAMEITEQAAANEWFERYVEHVMEHRPCQREEAEKVVRCNLGYWTGYCDSETAERVFRLFKCTHPIFGGAS